MKKKLPILYFPCRDSMKFILTTMKLTVVLLFLTTLSANGALYSQSVMVDVSVQNGTLESVFAQIRKQSDLTFTYNVEDIVNIKGITIDCRDCPVEDVLTRCLKGSGFTYQMADNVIVLRKADVLQQQQQQVGNTVTGKVRDADGTPIAGVTVMIKNTSTGTITDTNGDFTLRRPSQSDVVVFSCLGKKMVEITYAGQQTIVVTMQDDLVSIEEVVSTGYYSIPKERATGSFTKVDNKTFNYTPGPDILSRLDGITTDILFNNKQGSSAGHTLLNMTIRGPSTRANGDGRAPLIVLNNMIYNGSLDNINPNDVESITILKDAAATSIWGINAGNGVIVITTKKGNYNRPIQVSGSASFRVSQEPKLDYYPWLKSSDFIDLEKKLFDIGMYDGALTPTSYIPTVVSPVVELLSKQRQGLLSPEDAEAQIDAMRGYNFNDQLLKYVYRPQTNQQYALNINGGSDNINYMLSMGYDKQTAQIKYSDNQRITLNSMISFKPLKNMEVTSSVMLAYGTYNSGNVITWGTNYYPYARLADDDGNPLPLAMAAPVEWAREAGELRGLDWTYYPLKDMNQTENKRNTANTLINTKMSYRFSPVFTAEGSYQYNRSGEEHSSLEKKDAYSIRNDINIFTDIRRDVSDPLYRPIPLGGRFTRGNIHYEAHIVRGQLNVDKTWAGKHHLTAIAGAEMVDENTREDSPSPLYGYDANRLSSVRVDFTNPYPIYVFPSGLTYGTDYIPGQEDLSDRTFRSTSIYTNIGYTYDQRYIFTFSARKDASNMFGVDRNKRGTPLWSAGAAWNISNESFYNFDRLSYLKLRMTYGYSGNIARNQSAYLTLRLNGEDWQTGEQTATILNPPNPNLGWELVGQFNMGVDFATANGRLSGSVEYYRKISENIFATAPVDPTTGLGNLTTNSAAFKGTGVDISLKFIPVRTPSFIWNSSFMFSYNKNITTKYLYTYYKDNPYLMITGSGLEGSLGYIEGYDAYPVFSYKFAGLDPTNGNPQGYDAQGNISTDYSYGGDLFSPKDVSQLNYHGSGLPRIYGSFRNTFTWKGIELSLNITYKWNYYIRKQTVSYSNISTNWHVNKDYLDRWQAPGDEKHTTIPSMPGTLAELSAWPLVFRDSFYTSSSVNVAKGDHIRLNDIMLAYTLPEMNWGMKNMRIYANLTNVGILWRANKWKIDPDLGSLAIPLPKIFTLGISANF